MPVIIPALRVLLNTDIFLLLVELSALRCLPCEKPHIKGKADTMQLASSCQDSRYDKRFPASTALNSSSLSRHSPPVLCYALLLSKWTQALLLLQYTE